MKNCITYLITLLTLSTVLMVGCENASNGSATVKGNISSFDVTDGSVRAVRAVSVLSGVERIGNQGNDIVVWLDGTIDYYESAGEDGSFIFNNIEAGEYFISFIYGNETISYRGNSGQVASLNVPEGSVVEVLNIRVSGGHVNIGNIRTTISDGTSDNSNTSTNETNNLDNQIPNDDSDGSDNDDARNIPIPEETKGVARIVITAPNVLSSTSMQNMDSNPAYLDGSTIHCVLPTYDIISYGEVEFEVTQSGYLFLALNFGDQGIPAGGWVATRLTKSEFEAEGWVFKSDLLNGPGNEDRDFELAYKEVQNGDTYTLRCNKYEPPYPIELPEDFDMSNID